MGRVSDLVTEVLEEGEFDATPVQALRALTRRHRKMVVRARCFRKTVSVGPTVAEQRDYALPTDLVEIFEVTVDGVTYGNARHVDLSSNAQGLLWFGGIGGLTAPEEDTAGVGTLALIPTPGDAGQVVQVRGAFSPPDLSTADDTTLKITPDFDDALAAGGIASLMRRGTGDFRADIAQTFEQEFSDACEELRRQTNRRYRGPGPTQLRVVGFNA